ncbi:MAG: hypothetical protein DCF22_09210 [Leptolyngbya sp.]|nr:MAG: hypothetical protein DCF22_09210 [Leptolyngbya sp.]
MSSAIAYLVVRSPLARKGAIAVEGKCDRYGDSAIAFEGTIGRSWVFLGEGAIGLQVADAIAVEEGVRSLFGLRRRAIAVEGKGRSRVVLGEGAIAGERWKGRSRLKGKGAIAAEKECDRKN